jgi:exosortase D (VPLPA-CTERM-specific)
MIRKSSINKNWWLPAAIVLACLVFSYRSIIEKLVSQWMGSQDYSHGLLIVPIAAYLIWERRRELKAAEIGTDWRALPVLLLAVFVFIVGELGAELFTTRFSMLVFVVGSTWFLFGFQVFKILRFPLAFLFLMLPLPGFLYRNITFPLQILSSAGAVKFLHLLGISAFREGNVIDMGYTQFQVVEACNGLRFILPLFTLGVLFAYFGLKAAWKRALLIIATVPISIFANIFRIAGTGFIGNYWGVKAAEGFFHSFSGWAVFMLSVALFIVLTFILRKIPERAKNTAEAEKEPAAEGKGAAAVSWASLMTAVAIILAAPFIVGYMGRVAPVALKKPLAGFPLEFQERSGRKSFMAAEIWEQVGGQDYVSIDYFKDKTAPINFYVAYYEYQRKAGDFIHSPKLCLPGGGWFIEKSGVRHLKPNPHGGAGPEGLEFNELVVEKGGLRHMTYYWYQGRDRNFTSEYDAKFYMVWDGLWRRRTDGALVRLFMRLPQDMTLEEGRQILDSFALAASKELQQYLP